MIAISVIIWLKFREVLQPVNNVGKQLSMVLLNLCTFCGETWIFFVPNYLIKDGTTLMAESKEKLKSFLMKVKEESEKVGLKFNIEKAKIMESISITSWKIDGKTMETVTDYIFLVSRITADGDCGHEIKRCLLFGRKAMTNLDSMLKSRQRSIQSKLWFF